MTSPVTSETVYRIICDHPNGINRHDLSKKLGIPACRVDGLLVELEGTDTLVSEDGNGWLHKFNWKVGDYG